MDKEQEVMYPMLPIMEELMRQDFKRYFTGEISEPTYLRILKIDAPMVVNPNILAYLTP